MAKLDDFPRAKKTIDSYLDTAQMENEEFGNEFVDKAMKDMWNGIFAVYEDCKSILKDAWDKRKQKRLQESVKKSESQADIETATKEDKQFILEETQRMLDKYNELVMIGVDQEEIYVMGAMKKLGYTEKQIQEVVLYARNYNTLQTQNEGD